MPSFYIFSQKLLTCQLVLVQVHQADENKRTESNSLTLDDVKPKTNNNKNSGIVKEKRNEFVLNNIFIIIFVNLKVGISIYISQNIHHRGMFTFVSSSPL